MSKKRRREHPQVNTHLVEIYEDLANIDEKIRLKAAYTLLTKYVSQEKASGEQLKEILRRLIRGLCSSRKAARLGFSVALTEFLTELLGPCGKRVQGFEEITELLETLKRETHVAGNVSGQEERDHQFGRLFGAEAIIKSKILLQPNVAIEIWDQVLDIIYELAKKKAWLREECGFVLFTSIQLLQGQNPKHAQSIIDKLHANGLSKSPEGIAIWLALQAAFPGVRFPRGIWHHQNPFHPDELTKVAKILKDVPVMEGEIGKMESSVVQKGTWSSKLHFVWDVILKKLLNAKPADHQEKSRKSESISFVYFWERCVDDSLFAAASSDERKYWGFLLFQQAIANAPKHLVPSIFSKNFFRCLTNQLASTERYLHRTADKATKAILARVRSDPSVGPPILNIILGNQYADITFGKFTKTKTIESLLSQIDASMFKQVCAVYDEFIAHPGVQDEKLAASRRLVAADQLVSAVRNIPIEPSEQDLEPNQPLSAIESVLTLLAKYAYFNLEKGSHGQGNEPSPPIAQTSRHIFRSRISSCLTHAMAQPIDSEQLFYNSICTIQDRVENPESSDLLLDADDAVRQVIEQARKNLNKINTKVTKSSSGSTHAVYLRSLRLLYSLALLQMYNENSEALNILEELNDCFYKMLKRVDIEAGSTVLIEILLSFLSQPSQLLRRLTQQVFTACTSDVDEIGFQSMFKVLRTKESLSGQAEMFDQEEEDEGTSVASDVEEIDMAHAPSDSHSEGNDSGDDTSSGTSNSTELDSNGTDEDLAEFDAKLAQALGTRPGNEDLDAEDSSSSDEEMDDEQMELLDEHVEKILRERKKATSKKTAKKDAKETIVNFKCRVLELLEIYVKQQHTKSLALSLLLPLLHVIRTTTSPLVSSKACNVMREYARVCKGDGVPQIEDTDAIFDTLECVHADAMHEGSNAYASACSQASLLLVRVLAAHDRECLRRVVKIYGDTQEKALFDPGCKVKTAFFTDWLNWCTSARK